MEAVLTSTIEVARQVFASDGYALWRFDAGQGWHMVRSFGVSEQLRDRTILIPLFHGMSADEQDRVIEVLDELARPT